MSKSKTHGAEPTTPRSKAGDHIKPKAQRIAKQVAIAAANPKSWLLLCLITLSFIAWPAAAIASKACALVIFPDGMNRSGRSGGLVFQRNGRTRRFVVPSLVQNAATSFSRLSFASPSAGWNALSISDRESWINAIGFTSIDRFARPFVLKGKQLYVSLTKNLLTTGQVPISTAPLINSPLGNCNLVGAASVGGSTFTISSSVDTGSSCATTVPAGSWMVLKMTAQASAGRTRFGKSAYRVVEVLIPTTNLVSHAIFGLYTAQFGPLILGASIGIEGYIINATGQASARIQNLVTVAA